MWKVGQSPAKFGQNSGIIRANIRASLFSFFFPPCLSKYVVRNFRSLYVPVCGYADTGIEDRTFLAHEKSAKVHEFPPPPPPRRSARFSGLHGADSGMNSAIQAKHAKNVCAPQKNENRSRTPNGQTPKVASLLIFWGWAFYLISLQSLGRLAPHYIPYWK